MPSFSSTQWAFWRKIIFRFVVIYTFFYAFPLQWVGQLPIINVLGEWYGQIEKWGVELANQYIFHVKDVLISPAGSSDTSYVYAYLCLITLIAALGTLLGAFIATAVFMNVMMLNLSYNIPVKLFSIHLFVYSMILLVSDAQRLLDFFVLNRATAPTPTYQLPKKWMQNGRLLLKVAFVILFIIVPFYSSYESTLKPFNSNPKKELLTTGIFDVTTFETNGRMANDSLRWKDVVFDEYTGGSVQTSDTLFRIRYNRAYFAYSLDSLKQNISFKKRMGDSLSLFTLQCSLPDSNTVLLKEKVQNDSLRVVLKRRKQQFPLSEKPFDWLLESVS